MTAAYLRVDIPIDVPSAEWREDKLDRLAEDMRDEIEAWVDLRGGLAGYYSTAPIAPGLGRRSVEASVDKQPSWPVAPDALTQERALVAAFEAALAALPAEEAQP